MYMLGGIASSKGKNEQLASSVLAMDASTP
jgi:hypothetical protein